MGKIIPDSFGRRMVRDSMYIGKKRAPIYVQVSLNVTEMHRQAEVFRKQKGINISMFSCILYAYTQALAQHPQAMAMLDWRNRMVFFDHVDVLLPRLVKEHGESSLGFGLIKKIDRMSFEEASQRIHQMVRQPFEIKHKSQRLFLGMPDFARQFAYSCWNAFPKHFAYQMGNSFCSFLYDKTIHNSFVVPHIFSSSLIHTSGLIAVYYRQRMASDPSQIIHRVSFSMSLDHHVADGALLMQLSNAFAAIIENHTFLKP